MSGVCTQKYLSAKYTLGNFFTSLFSPLLSPLEQHKLFLIVHVVSYKLRSKKLKIITLSTMIERLVSSGKERLF